MARRIVPKVSYDRNKILKGQPLKFRKEIEIDFYSNDDLERITDALLNNI